MEQAILDLFEDLPVGGRLPVMAIWSRLRKFQGELREDREINAALDMLVQQGKLDEKDGSYGLA